MSIYDIAEEIYWESVDMDHEDYLDNYDDDIAYIISILEQV